MVERPCLELEGVQGFLESSGRLGTVQVPRRMMASMALSVAEGDTKCSSLA